VSLYCNARVIVMGHCIGMLMSLECSCDWNARVIGVCVIQCDVIR